MTGTYFTHLECSVPCGAPARSRSERHHLCDCGAPLLARYDLAAAANAWSRDSLAARERSMWRYRELMPLLEGEAPVTLGEGWTPMMHTKRLGAAVGMSERRAMAPFTNFCSPASARDCTSAGRARPASCAIAST